MNNPLQERRTYDVHYVRSLFDRIASRYDLLNHLLSSGIDVLWRKRAIRLLRPHKPQIILDVATGTGDLALEAASLKPRQIVGVDVSSEMLERARTKARRRKLDAIFSFQTAEAERLPFPDAQFDAVTVGFGVRNFASLNDGLSEILRVLRPGGAAVILEFSRPTTFLVRHLYELYSRSVIPLLGGLVSGHREAYEYLPGTIREFPDGKAFVDLLKQLGYAHVAHRTMTFGIASLYYGIKP